MSLSSNNFWRICILGTLLFVLTPAVSSAGWMGFRNDTGEAIIIQETLVINGKPMLAKPQKLNPNEAVRDVQFNVVGHRKITIFEAKNPKVPIYTGNFPCPGVRENLLYSLKLDKAGKIIVDVIRTPVPK
jgi:hypothetical protein